MNAISDNSPINEVIPLPQGAVGEEGPLEPLRDDGDGDDLPRHVDSYPSYLNKLFDPDRVGDINGDGDEFDVVGGVAENPGAGPLDPYGTIDPLRPLARYSGSTTVFNRATVLEIVVFAPGAFAAFDPPHPLSDLASSDLGYPSVIIVDDPTSEPGPDTVTNTCTPRDTTVLLWGKSRDNPCLSGACPNDDTPCGPGPCGVNVCINSFGEAGCPSFVDSGTGPCTAYETAGCVRYANPPADSGIDNTGTHLYATFTQTLRDVDNDGIENQFDTCPFDVNLDGDPRSTSGPDGDMIDSACDPTGDDTGGGNHDGDEIGSPPQPWLNAGDNCPLYANSDQKESELLQPDSVARPNGGPKVDGIGDACDSEGGGSDTVANGHFHTSFEVVAKCIGGTDSDGDSFCDATEDALGSYKYSAQSTPEGLDFDFSFPLANKGSGLDADSDGIPDNDDEEGFANDDPPGSADDQAEEPFQTCNDNVDNDNDGIRDNDEADCAGANPNPDTDLDGLPDADETACGSDPNDATKLPERLGNSVDDDGDTTIDEEQAAVAGADCDGKNV